MTPYIAGLRTGAWRLVPVEDEALYARYDPAWDRMMPCHRNDFGAVEYRPASPDATSALLAEIEGLRGATQDAYYEAWKEDFARKVQSAYDPARATKDQTDV